MPPLDAPPASPRPSRRARLLLNAYFRLLFARPTRPFVLRALLLKERLTAPVVIHFLSPDFRADPYPTYARLRTHAPVHWSELGHAWILSRSADLDAALRDPRFSSDRMHQLYAFQEVMNALGGVGPAVQLFSETMLSVDPPDHTRLRSLVNKAFTPRSVEAMRARIQAIVDDLLTAAEQQPRLDLMRDLAVPLPVIVIAEMLGVPPADRDLFKRWSDDLGAVLDPVIDRAILRRGDRAVLAMSDYFRPLIRDRRTHPREDLLSALVAAEEEGRRLSEDELFAMCILILAAGNETATNLIGNGVLALLRHPDAWRRLRDDPALMPSAVEELLRYDSPVQFLTRVVTENMTLHGRTLGRGQFVLLCIGAANRDPDQFSDPDRLLLDRPNTNHLAFGRGIHYCLGAPLARLEGQIALAALLRRWPHLHLTTEAPAWRDTLTLRGLATLPVKI